MALPHPLIDRFPPSPTLLLDLARRHVDDSMLWEIAKADYGHRADEAFAALRSIRDGGDIPAPMSGQLSEVLELTRWCCPEQPNAPPFAPGPTGRRGHQTRLFACAALLRAASDPSSQFHDHADDSTLANCLVSAGVLGDEFSEAFACYLTWQFERCDNPVFVALSLLIVAIRIRPDRMAEPDLSNLAKWVLEQDEAFRRRNGVLKSAEPAPVAFSLQQGLWQSIALELENTATRISHPVTRENVKLCALLLDPGWGGSI